MMSGLTIMEPASAQVVEGAVMEQTLTLEQARHQANVLAKARDLTKRGYTGRWLTPEVVEVTGPEGRTYHLDLMARTCECKGFGDNGFCSHLLGYDTLVAEQEAPDA